MSLTQSDIRAAISEIYTEGSNPNDLEGLLIHSDDWIGLLKTIPEYNIGMMHDEIRLFGVKLIKSQQIERGTIFKIFNKSHLSNPSMMWDVPFAQLPESSQTISGSGVIPGMEHLVETSSMVDGIKIDKEEKKHERKHSNMRKIELD